MGHSAYGARLPRRRYRFRQEASSPGTGGGRHQTHREQHQTMITSYEFLATWLRARFDDEKGASLVEYALLVALIAVVCIAAVTLLGKDASSKFSTVGASIDAS